MHFWLKDVNVFDGMTTYQVTEAFEDEVQFLTASVQWL